MTSETMSNTIHERMVRTHLNQYAYHLVPCLPERMLRAAANIRMFVHVGLQFDTNTGSGQSLSRPDGLATLPAHMYSTAQVEHMKGMTKP